MMNMVIEATCPFCGAITPIEVNADDYAAWQAGELVQNAFPYLDAEDREVLISGICYDCQSEVFDEDEDDYEDYEDDVDEMGFNPYMGCYDFDC
jgi:hypothetical protein